MSDIEFYCPKCDGYLVVQEEGSGLAVPCPICEKPIIIPEIGKGAVYSEDEPDKKDNTKKTAKSIPQSLHTTPKSDELADRLISSEVDDLEETRELLKATKLPTKRSTQTRAITHSPHQKKNTPKQNPFHLTQKYDDVVIPDSPYPQEAKQPAPNILPPNMQQPVQQAPNMPQGGSSFPTTKASVRNQQMAQMAQMGQMGQMAQMAQMGQNDVAKLSGTHKKPAMLRPKHPPNQQALQEMREAQINTGAVTKSKRNNIINYTMIAIVAVAIIGGGYVHQKRKMSKEFEEAEKLVVESQTDKKEKIKAEFEEDEKRKEILKRKKIASIFTANTKLEQKLASYFASTKIEERAQFVRRPTRALPKMEKFYKANSPKPLAFMSYTLESLIKHRERYFALIKASFEDSILKPKNLYIEYSEKTGEFRIDWESSEPYQEKSLAEFIKTPDYGNAYTFRLLGTLDNFYVGDFKGKDAEYVCVKLRNDGIEPSIIYGYCKVGTESVDKLHNAFKKAKMAGKAEAAITLKLLIPQGSRTGTQALIAEVIGESWLVD